MFAINITFGRNDTQKVLVFKTMDAAEKVQSALHNPVLKSHDYVIIQDDFGSCFSVRCDAITAFSYEDLDKTAEMQVELAVHNQKVTAKAQSVVMNDPAIRAAMAMSGVGHPGMGPGLRLQG